MTKSRKINFKLKFVFLKESAYIVPYSSTGGGTGMSIFIIIILHLGKQICIQTVVKTGLLQEKSRQSKTVVIMQRDLLITDTATLLGAALCSSRRNNYKNTCQL